MYCFLYQPDRALTYDRMGKLPGRVFPMYTSIYCPANKQVIVLQTGMTIYILP